MQMSPEQREKCITTDQYRRIQPITQKRYQDILARCILDTDPIIDWVKFRLMLAPGCCWDYDIANALDLSHPMLHGSNPVCNTHTRNLPLPHSMDQSTTQHTLWTYPSHTPWIKSTMQHTLWTYPSHTPWIKSTTQHTLWTYPSHTPCIKSSMQHTLWTYPSHTPWIKVSIWKYNVGGFPQICEIIIYQ